MCSKDYPEIFYPNISKVNDNLIERENFKQGFTETVFEYNLKKYFKNYLLKNFIINDGRPYPYYPDYILFIPNKNLIIDIELDEPYVYNSKKPIHIDDDLRNKYFLDNGWGIIRFAEIQTVKFPKLCCKIISEYIRNITNESIWIEGFHELEDLEFIKAWNYNEAKNMAEKSFRNTYLDCLTSFVYNKPSICIIADGIFLNSEVNNTKKALRNVNEILKFNDSAKISIFTKLLSRYFQSINKQQVNEDKIYIEFSIYVSQHHSFYNFSFDSDFIELDNYIINIYFIRTDKLICFDIIEKIQKEQLQHIFLVADDPAYFHLIETLNVEELILIKKHHDSFMPNNYKYINIDNLIEPSLEVKYK